MIDSFSHYIVLQFLTLARQEKLYQLPCVKHICPVTSACYFPGAGGQSK